MKTLTCKYCHELFQVYPYRAKTAMFCSFKCTGKYRGLDKDRMREIRKLSRGNWIDGRSKAPRYNSIFAKRRKLRKKNAVGFHSEEEWGKIKKLYNYMCLCCKKQEPEIILTRDHIMPLSKGGSNFIENIQPLCHSCNARKFTKILDYRDGGVFI